MSRVPTVTEALVTAVVDGQEVTVPQGSTILQACQALGVEVPTLCWWPTLEPKGACRLCVVEVEGSRTLVPACARTLEPGMKVHTQSPRVRTSRRMVLELLASSVDLGAADPQLRRWMEAYGADPERFGPPAPPAGPKERETRHPGHHPEAPLGMAETVAMPVKVDNDLYVRDLSRCVLCYRCVQACGDQAQYTFAIAVAGRGMDAHISTEFDVPLPASSCVYCGNCIGVCPTGALMVRTEYEMREEGTWDPERQTVTETICPYCGVGCTLALHVQDNRIVKVTSPWEGHVTRGHLCIKGRFGVTFVHASPGSGEGEGP
jgi:NADP-reducing hydrogenase subunit HndD